MKPQGGHPVTSGVSGIHKPLLLPCHLFTSLPAEKNPHEFFWSICSSEKPALCQEEALRDARASLPWASHLAQARRLLQPQPSYLGAIPWGKTT